MIANTNQISPNEPGLSLPRDLSMKRQKRPISATCSKERRTASASLATCNARFASCSVASSMKKDLRFNCARLAICSLFHRQAYVSRGQQGWDRQHCKASQDTPRRLARLTFAGVYNCADAEIT